MRLMFVPLNPDIPPLGIKGFKPWVRANPPNSNDFPSPSRVLGF